MIPYILKVALILAGCLCFYKLLLGRETFYRTNRIVLIVCLFISFSLPLLRVPQQLSLRKTDKEAPVIIQKTWPITAKQTEAKITPATTPVAKAPATERKAAPSSGPVISIEKAMNWLLYLYWFGVIVFGISFLFQVIFLLWRTYRNPYIQDGIYRIVEMSGDKAPCSFGNTIFINPDKYEPETYNQILMHEKIHIREKHTLDILIAELVLIFQWFNPFAWIYRREIENNLEFLTDDGVMQQKIDKTSYQLSLLKVSAPHFPLSLTTNYNQSILKKRIAMMNTKRSNLHTAWKYFFLLPVLALFASLLNEPHAQLKTKNKITKEKSPMGNQGYWFARIKGDRINIMFSDEEINDDSTSFNGHHSFSGTTFKLSELSSVPRGAAGTFSITREAGKMEFTGKFEENTGMGKYNFVADKAFDEYMSSELKEKLDEDDAMAFFVIDITKSYLQMLKKQGFDKMTKDDVVAMGALHVDEAFIRSVKENGFKGVDMDNLVALKALGIDDAYIKEIRSVYKNVDLEQLISFKAQNIDKSYIEKVREMRKDGKKDGDDDADDIVTYKSMDITPEFINSFKSVGFTNIPHEELVSLKALNITPEYIKSIQGIGFNDLDIEAIISLKALGVTPEYVKTFRDMGYTNLKAEDVTALKAQNITPEFIRSFESLGYKIDLEEAVSFKALGVTPEFIKGFEAIGYKNIPAEDLAGLKAVGVTPAYIKSMKEKGFNYDKIQKYITLKSIED